MDELIKDELIPPNGEVYRNAVSSPSGEQRTPGAQLLHLFIPRAITHSPDLDYDPHVAAAGSTEPIGSMTPQQAHIRDVMNFEDPKNPFTGAHIYGRRALGHLDLKFSDKTPKDIKLKAMEHLNPAKFALFKAFTYRNRALGSSDRKYVSYIGMTPVQNEQESTKVMPYFHPADYAEGHPITEALKGFDYSTGQIEMAPGMEGVFTGYNDPSTLHTLNNESDIKDALGMGHRIDTEYEPHEGNTPESPFYRMGGRSDRVYRYLKTIQDANPKISHLIYAAGLKGIASTNSRTQYGAVTRVGDMLFHHSEISSLADLEDHLKNFGTPDYVPKTTTWGTVPFTPEIAPVESYNDLGEHIFNPMDMKDRKSSTRVVKGKNGQHGIAILPQNYISLKNRGSVPIKAILTRKSVRDRGYSRGEDGYHQIPAKDLLDEGLTSLSSEVGNKIQGLAVQKHLKKAARVLEAVERHHKIFRQLLGSAYPRTGTPEGATLDPEAITSSHVTGHLANILAVIGSSLRFLNYKKHFDPDSAREEALSPVSESAVESSNNPSDQEIGIASRALMPASELNEIESVLPRELNKSTRKFGEANEYKKQV